MITNSDLQGEIREVNRQVMYLKDVIEKQRQEKERLLDIIHDIITLTFEDNTSFETIIFQRKDCAPIIYHNGNRLDTKDAAEVNVTFGDHTSTRICIANEG